MPELPEGTVRDGGLGVFYHEAGAGEPILLLPAGTVPRVHYGSAGSPMNQPSPWIGIGKRVKRVKPGRVWRGIGRKRDTA
ncbi:MAG: hypothetical protein HYU24_09440 [Candidatus Rokubacteria bacterium]|nr:hypothetical protein [Candidatus Rokubacteria bacterium]